MIITEIDYDNNIAYSECGVIYNIDAYLDVWEDPCDYEEAYYISIDDYKGNTYIKQIPMGYDYDDEEEEDTCPHYE